MRIDEIRNRVENEEIDYVMLMSMLSGYSNPRDKISRLIRAGDLVRVKKGLYVFGPKAARGPFSLETLANLMHGPSAISLEYALSWYGMIPERVSTVTSVTPSRNKFFTTPVGLFSYTHQDISAFAEGTALIALDRTRRVLMATKEKAVADLLALSRATPHFDTAETVRIHLVESLRIDDEQIDKFSLPRLQRLKKVQNSKNVSLLTELVAHRKGYRHA